MNDVNQRIIRPKNPAFQKQQRNVKHCMLRLIMRHLLMLCFVVFKTNFPAVAQIATLPIDDWVKKLSEQADVDNNDFREMDYGLDTQDSAVFFTALAELEKKEPRDNHYFKAKLLCLDARAQKKFRFLEGKPLVKQLCTQALNEAYITGDNNLVALVSWIYGELMYAYEEIELAVTYCLKAMELNDGLLSNKLLNYNSALLGEMLFRTRDYEKSIYYSRKALNNWADTSAFSGYFKMKCWNTLGQGYQQTGKLDSALISYNHSMQLANTITRFPYNIPPDTWKAINAGFTGQVFFLQQQYEKAAPLFEYDYNTNKTFDYNIAGYSIQWLAKISLVQGKKDSALRQIKESLRLLQMLTPYTFQNKTYLQKTYSTAADVYRALRNPDSFYRYTQLYATLHDSLEKVAIRSSMEITQLRIENQKNYQAVQVLQKEKQAEELKRNFIIAAIIMLFVIAVLMLSRQWQKLKFKQQLAQQEKAAAKTEVAAAREQLTMFTQNIIEKTALIEKLEQQVKTKELNREQQQLVAELSSQTILTEDEWEKFKTLFEKIYPGFFVKLKEQVSDITPAEQRMAALIRLRLETKQIAAMLGISADSVHKTRQRLRRRLRIDADINIESFLAGI